MIMLTVVQIENDCKDEELFYDHSAKVGIKAKYWFETF